MAIIRKGFLSTAQSMSARPIQGRTIQNKRIQSSYYGVGDIGEIEPEIHDPLLNVINFYLPYNYRILNQWMRYYDKFHPLIRNSLNLHSEVPWASFDLSVSDAEIRVFYENMCDDLNLLNFFTASTREYFLLGESFPLLDWDEDLNSFSSLILLNPDYIIIKVNPFTQETKFFRDIVNDKELHTFLRESSHDQYDNSFYSISSDLYESLQKDKELEIPFDRIGHIANKTVPYDIRGTSTILSALKDLMYEDKLRVAQYTIASRHILPIEHWVIGEGSDWIPLQEELDSFRDLLRELGNDPLFSLVTPPGYKYESYGITGKLLPIIPEFELVENRILTALFTSKAITHGEGPTYSNAAVAMEVLQARYDTVKDKHLTFVNKKIFTPVAEANEFYMPTKGEVLGHYQLANRKPELVRLREEIKLDLATCESLERACHLRCHLAQVTRDLRNDPHELMIPIFVWKSKVNLKDENQLINFAFRLRDKLQLPLRKVYELLKLDFDESMAQIKTEKEEHPELYPVEREPGLPSRAPGEVSKEMFDREMLDEDELPTGVDRMAPGELTTPFEAMPKI